MKQLAPLFEIVKSFRIDVATLKLNGATAVIFLGVVLLIGSYLAFLFWFIGVVLILIGLLAFVVNTNDDSDY